MKQRVLIIAPYNSGTIASCSLNLWKALKQVPEIEVKCVVKHKLPTGFPEFDSCDFYSNHPPKSGLKNLLSTNSQISWVRRQKRIFKPSLTISTLFSCSALNVLAGCDDIKIGIFHSPHYQAKANGRIGYAITLFYYKYLFPRLDKLFCVSEEVKQSILESFPGIDPKKVSVVYNAHDVEEIQRKSKEDISDKSENEIFQNDVIIYVGRFDRNKAPERALEAFASSSVNAKCHLVYVGGSDEGYTNRLKDLAEKWGISNRIHFLGKKSNPFKYIARSKALVSCSYSEGLPGVIIEAQILGIPVVATNSSQGIWEIFSCHKDYGEIKENYLTNSGIITPNTGNKSDIGFLSDALTQIIDYPRNDSPNPFIERIGFKEIATKFVD